MGLLVLSAVFLVTVAIGAVLARGILAIVLHVVTSGGLPPVSALRTVASGLTALVR